MEMPMPLRFSSSRLRSDSFFIPHLLHRSPKTKTPSFITTAITTSPSCFRTRPPDQVNILVVGSTGYIGKFVVSELCRRGFHVISIERIRDNGASSKHHQQQYGGRTTVCFSDVTDPDALNRSLASLSLPLDAAVCCLASRTGGVQDSWRVDYKASRNSLAAARRHGATHFVLLSAICVQKPLLEFQRAKLRFEAELSAEAAEDPSFSYSIVRPTAFFKSLAGQVDAVKKWKMPFVLFGDGKLCSCKPISARDLASFIADCVVDESKAGKVLPVGGPGKALTPLQQAEMLFRLLGRQPSFAKVPVRALDFVIRAMEMLAKIFPAFMEDAAELGRIVRYYAVESMLVLDSDTGHYSQEKTPSYGTDTLEDFLAAAIRDGMNGQ